MRLLNCLKYDLISQFRQGFYLAYGFVLAIYLLVLWNLPVEYRAVTSLYLLVTDTTVLGFFFIGGIVLLEKDQQVHNSLFLTPLSSWEYLFSKIISLSILILPAATILKVAVTGLPVDFLFFFLGIILSGVLFVSLGILLSVVARTLNGYFGLAMLYSLVFIPAVLDYIGLFPLEFEILFWMPLKPQIILLSSAFEPVGINEKLLSLFILLAWAVLFIFLSKKAVDKGLNKKLGEAAL